MQLTLREYQTQAVNKMVWSINIDGGSLVVLPQGAGKSVVIASFAYRVDNPILILQPSKELLEQNMSKLLHYVDESEIGVFSASMNQKTVNKFTFATIQSAYKYPKLFEHFKVVLIDEASFVNPSSLDGMYNKFFKAMGNPKVIGLTATPFRMDSYYKKGYRWKYDIETIHCTRMINRFKSLFWKNIVYVQQIEDLIKDGYLCPLRYVDSQLIDQSAIPTNKSGSDFDLEKYENLIGDKERRIVDGIEWAKKEHKSVLVFASSIAQANRLKEAIVGAEVVFGTTNKKERERVIDGFKSLAIQVVINVGCLTYGFDHPELDCILLCRPTRSLVLHLQMLGRGTRIADGKVCCDVIDFVGNTKFLGTVESMRVEKYDGKWDVKTNRGFWHLRTLYSYKIKQKK